MSDHRFIPKSNSKIVPPFIPKPKESLEAENARLKAEVERLAAEVSFDKRVQLHVDKLVAEFTQCQVERLQAEVERLRKAGDELSWAFAFAVSRDDGKESGLIKAWRAAKEGNQL